MFDLDKLTEILQTITRNKTRSFLTAFGVFWGIFMLVALIGGGNGLDYFLKKQIGGFATNSCLVWTNVTSEPYKGFRKGRWWSMNSNDLKILKAQIPEIEHIAGINTIWDGTFIRGERKQDAQIEGVTPSYAKIKLPVMLKGRYINDMDVWEKRKVCVIGERVYEAMFMNGEDPIGQTVRWNDVPFQVIGVFKPLSEGMMINGDDREKMMIPLSTMDLISQSGSYVDLITLTAKKGYRISELEEKVSQILKREHQIAPDDKKAVFVMNIEKEFMMFENLFLGITILVWIVGLGTLIAGVIGVSNIMMVTVKERTQEIGVRRALGAKPRQILSQILSETAVLTGVSGLLGIAFGVLVLQLADLGISGGGGETSGFMIPFWTAISAAVVLLVLSLSAGLLPAWRAMQIKAIDALRDE